MMLKIAVVAPMPKAKVMIVTAIKAGSFLNLRIPNRISCRNVRIKRLLLLPVIKTVW
jgi:hypothetical protein